MCESIERVNVMKKIKPFGIFILPLLITLFLDIYTKRWAEENLATPEHPIPIIIEEEREEAIGEIIEKKYGIPFNEQNKFYITKLTQKRDYKIDDKVFDFGNEKFSNISGFYVFTKERLSFPPRRILIREPFEVEKLFQFVRTMLSLKDIRKIVFENLKNITLMEYLSWHLQGFDDKKLKNLIENYLYPIPSQEEKIDLQTKVKKNEIYLLKQRSINLIRGNLQLIYAENPGAAWGFLANAPESFRHSFFSVLSVIAIFVIIYILWKTPREEIITLLSLGAILGGAVGNLTDRFCQRYVVDFIDMYYGVYHWPTYNVADIGITIGVIFIVIKMIRKEKKKEKKDKTKGE